MNFEIENARTRFPLKHLKAPSNALIFTTKGKDKLKEFLPESTSNKMNGIRRNSSLTNGRRNSIHSSQSNKQPDLKSQSEYSFRLKNINSSSKGKRQSINSMNSENIKMDDVSSSNINIHTKNRFEYKSNMAGCDDPNTILMTIQMLDRKKEIRKHKEEKRLEGDRLTMLENMKDTTSVLNRLEIDINKQKERKKKRIMDMMKTKYVNEHWKHMNWMKHVKTNVYNDLFNINNHIRCRSIG